MKKFNKHVKSLINIGFFINIFGILFPGEWVTVDTVLTFSTSVSINEARVETLALCRKMAIRKAVPTSMEVYSHFYRSQVEIDDYYHDETALGSFVISANSGLIVDEKILKGIPLLNDNSPSFDYKMTVKAKVEPVKGERDPSVYIKLWADDDKLLSGQELTLHAESSINGYLYLFWFYADNSVAMLFPNEYSNNNAISKKQVFNIPSEAEQKNGLTYRVIGLPDKDITIETIYLVLAKQKIANQEKLMHIGSSLKNLSAGEKSYTEFQQWLSRIPLSQRDETAIQIMISKE